MVVPCRLITRQRSRMRLDGWAYLFISAFGSVVTKGFSAHGKAAFGESIIVAKRLRPS